MGVDSGVVLVALDGGITEALAVYPSGSLNNLRVYENQFEVRCIPKKSANVNLIMR